MSLVKTPMKLYQEIIELKSDEAILFKPDEKNEENDYINEEELEGYRFLFQYMDWNVSNKSFNDDWVATSPEGQIRCQFSQKINFTRRRKKIRLFECEVKISV